MLIVYSHNEIPIRLTEERWRHICERHPEMFTQQEQVLETISSPDMILEGDYGELLAVRHYAQTPLTSKYLVAAYKEIEGRDGFVLTAYFSSRTSTTRTVLWKH